MDSLLSRFCRVLYGPLGSSPFGAWPIYQVPKHAQIRSQMANSLSLIHRVVSAQPFPGPCAPSHRSKPCGQTQI